MPGGIGGGVPPQDILEGDCAKAVFDCAGVLTSPQLLQWTSLGGSGLPQRWQSCTGALP